MRLSLPVLPMHVVRYIWKYMTMFIGTQNTRHFPCQHAHKPLQIIKALTATGWGKQKETLMAT